MRNQPDRLRCARLHHETPRSVAVTQEIAGFQLCATTAFGSAPNSAPCLFPPSRVESFPHPAEASMSTKACYRSLCSAGERLDPILKPLGYVFQPDEMIPGLPFASAVFIQGELVINIYYKRGPLFGPAMYSNARGGMDHGELMRTLGFADRQLLVCEEAALRSISLV